MKNVPIVTLLLIVFRTLVAPQATNAQQIEIAEPGRRGSAAQRATHKSDPGGHPIDGAVIYDHDTATNLGDDVFGNVICDFEKDAPGRNSAFSIAACLAALWANFLFSSVSRSRMCSSRISLSLFSTTSIFSF